MTFLILFLTGSDGLTMLHSFCGVAPSPRSAPAAITSTTVPVCTAEALQRFKPRRMLVNSCPHCGGMHLYSMNEGHLKVWDEHAMHEAGRVA